MPTGQLQGAMRQVYAACRSVSRMSLEPYLRSGAGAASVARASAGMFARGVNKVPAAGDYSGTTGTRRALDSGYGYSIWRALARATGSPQ
jgi:hypothetical protein